MTDPADKRIAIRAVLPFVFRHWLLQPYRTAVVLVGFLGATAADLFMPVYSGHLVDASSSGPYNQAARHAALAAVGGIVALGLASVILRILGLQAIVPFTLQTMSDVARETFMRIQRFSTDWHANSFAGSNVRKIMRGMWAFDLLNNTILMSLLLSLTVLVGSMILLGLHWSALGRVIAIGAACCRDDADILGPLHRACRTGLQRMGHEGRRHAGRCADLQRGGEIVRP